MTNLIKAEFFRLRKDKVALFGLIIAAGILFFQYGITFALYSIGNSQVAENGLEMLFGGRTTFLSSFNMGNNVGFLMMIIIGILLVKDFNQNTVRQKVIYGHKRSHIYLSLFIVNLAYTLIVILMYAIILLFLYSVTFGYGYPFTTAEALKLLASTGIGILIVTVYVSVVTLIATKTKSTGATIGTTIAVVFGESILVSSLLMYIMISNPNWSKTVTYALRILPAMGSNWLAGMTLDVTSVLVIVFSSLFWIVGLNLLGIHLFNKSDIK